MDHRWNWEQGTLMSELIQGMELAKQLRLHLGAASSAESRDLLVQKILSSYDKALMMLKPNNAAAAATTGVPAAESPLSINCSPTQCDDLDKDNNQNTRDVSKKR